MNARCLWLAGWLWACTALAAAGTEPRLTGLGTEQVDAQTLENVRQQVHNVPGHETAELWQCDCRCCITMQECNQLGYIVAYLTPRLSTPRLLRGEVFTFERSPYYRRTRDATPAPFGGWSSWSKNPSEYAVVAAPGQTFTPGSIPGDPVQVTGELTDEDVLALVEASCKMVPAQRTLSLERSGPDRVRVEAAVKSKKSWRNFTVDFRQVAGRWQAATKKLQWGNG